MGARAVPARAGAARPGPGAPAEGGLQGSLTLEAQVPGARIEVEAISDDYERDERGRMAAARRQRRRSPHVLAVARVRPPFPSVGRMDEPDHVRADISAMRRWLVWCCAATRPSRCRAAARACPGAAALPRVGRKRRDAAPECGASCARCGSPRCARRGGNGPYGGDLRTRDRTRRVWFVGPARRAGRRNRLLAARTCAAGAPARLVELTASGGGGDPTRARAARCATGPRGLWSTTPGVATRRRPPSRCWGPASPPLRLRSGRHPGGAVPPQERRPAPSRVRGCRGAARGPAACGHPNSQRAAPAPAVSSPAVGDPNDRPRPSRAPAR